MRYDSGDDDAVNRNVNRQTNLTVVVVSMSFHLGHGGGNLNDIMTR